MKKYLAMMLAPVLCLGLCACGAAANEEVILPTVPQVAVPTLPARISQEAAEENTEAIDPTGETYPWEVEFIEEDYNRMEGNCGDGGKGIFWLEKGELFMIRRSLSYWTNGDIEDVYQYRSGPPSHIYFWGADGSYRENHYLDDGRIETDANGSVNTVYGTLVYSKEIAADGSYIEYHHTDEGYTNIRVNANGCYEEFQSFVNGNQKKFITNDPNAGTYQEVEYFENGNLKYAKIQTPESTHEEQYSEEGYRTYFYFKNADREMELTADDTGKLVKAVQNGATIEDAATLAKYATDYNFRQ